MDPTNVFASQLNKLLAASDNVKSATSSDGHENEPVNIFSELKQQHQAMFDKLIPDESTDEIKLEVMDIKKTEEIIEENLVPKTKTTLSMDDTKLAREQLMFVLSEMHELEKVSAKHVLVRMCYKNEMKRISQLMKELPITVLVEIDDPSDTHHLYQEFFGYDHQFKDLTHQPHVSSAWTFKIAFTCYADFYNLVQVNEQRKPIEWHLQSLKSDDVQIEMNSSLFTCTLRTKES